MKKWIAILTLAAMIAACASCGSAEQQTLKVGIMPDFDSIPFAVAAIQGYLPENIELELFMSPMDRDSALYAGALDGTISDILSACLLREGGYDAVITSKTDGCYGVLTAEEIADARGLEGLDIGMSLNTVIEYVTYRIIEEAGGDADSSGRVSVPKIPSRLEMLFAGQIGAIAVPEPYVSAARERGAHVVATSADLGINPGMMLFMREAADEKTDEIEALYAAYNKAVEYIGAHEAGEYLPAVIEYLGLPPEALGAALPAYTAAEPPARAEIEAVGEWLVLKGLIGSAYSYDELVFEIK